MRRATRSFPFPHTGFGLLTGEFQLSRFPSTQGWRHWQRWEAGWSRGREAVGSAWAGGLLVPGSTILFLEGWCGAPASHPRHIVSGPETVHKASLLPMQPEVSMDLPPKALSSVRAPFTRAPGVGVGGESTRTREKSQGRGAAGGSETRLRFRFSGLPSSLLRAGLLLLRFWVRKKERKP